MGRSLVSVLIPLALVLAPALAPSGAAAYPAPVDFDGSLMRWDVGISDPAITYTVVADREEHALAFGTAVDEAASMWSTVPTSYFAFRKAQPDERPQVTVNLRTTLDGSAYSAGYAIFDEYDDKAPLHCSIFVVVVDGLSYNSMAKTFLHELGHCAGLGHTLIPQAIMSYELDANTFGLDVDDRAALTRLYPADGSNPKLPPGCAAGAVLQAGSAAALALALLLPLILAGMALMPASVRNFLRMALPVLMVVSATLA